MFLGIGLVGVGLAVSAVALWMASALLSSVVGGSQQPHVVSGFHSTALLPGVYPNPDPVTAHINVLYHIALYSEVVTAVGVALIVDGFLGNPLSHFETLLLKRARLSTFLRKVKSEKSRLSALVRRPPPPKKGDSPQEDKLLINKRIRDLRRLEISIESDLRDIDWNIRETSETINSQKVTLENQAKLRQKRRKLSVKEKIQKRLLRSTPQQKAVKQILNDLVFITEEEKRDKESLKILLEDRANQLRALSTIASSRKDSENLENMYYAVMRLSRGEKLEDRILARLDYGTRRKMRKAESNINTKKKMWELN
jgi:hypothetical protein